MNVNVEACQAALLHFGCEVSPWSVNRRHYPRESFREGLCNHRRWFVCLSVCLFVCLFVTTITK